MQALMERLEAIVAGEQLTYWGVAQLEDCRESLTATGSRLAAGFPRALALGVAIPGSIVDLLPERDDPAVSVSYHFHGYQVLNTRLDLAASRVASMLERAGYRALPVSAAERIDSERICALVSHKFVARRAGLGWIGKNCLLITPEHGPRVRWISVLTDAPFDSIRQSMPERCGNCRACADACPAGALSGRTFSEHESRATRLDARKCETYIRSLAGRIDRHPVCGMCLHACPWGRARSRKSDPLQAY